MGVQVAIYASPPLQPQTSRAGRGRDRSVWLSYPCPLSTEDNPCHRLPSIKIIVVIAVIPLQVPVVTRTCWFPSCSSQQTSSFPRGTLRLQGWLKVTPVC